MIKPNYANIGSCYSDLDEVPLAIKYYEMALKVDGSLAFARENIEELKHMTGS